MLDSYTPPPKSVGGDKANIQRKRSGRPQRPVMIRFFEQVANREPDECWNWIGHKAGGKAKYGRFYYDGRVQQAHRVSYMIHVGPIPDGLDILHSCDNPLCVNPAHLRPGTHLENMQEKCRKGRLVQIVFLKGAANINAKLTTEQVFELRRDCAAGMSYRAAARKYKVSSCTASKVARGLMRKDG